MNDVGESVLFEFGVASRPAMGETVSGDLHHIATFPRGALIAVVDGVGHGEAAATAAQIAVDAIRGNAYEPLPTLLARCHEALNGTRGAVLTLASVDTAAETVTWLGVGNVEARLLRVQ